MIQINKRWNNDVRRCRSWSEVSVLLLLQRRSGAAWVIYAAQLTKLCSFSVVEVTEAEQKWSKKRRHKGMRGNRTKSSECCGDHTRTDGSWWLSLEENARFLGNIKYKQGIWPLCLTLPVNTSTDFLPVILNHRAVAQTRAAIFFLFQFCTRDLRDCLGYRLKISEIGCPCNIVFHHMVALLHQSVLYQAPIYREEDSFL